MVTAKRLNGVVSFFSKSVVGIASRLRPGRCGVQIALGGRYFFFSKKFRPVKVKVKFTLEQTTKAQRGVEV